MRNQFEQMINGRKRKEIPLKRGGAEPDGPAPIQDRSRGLQGVRPMPALNLGEVGLRLGFKMAEVTMDRRDCVDRRRAAFRAVERGAIFASAVKDELIAANPAVGADKPALSAAL
jgi:hypothetical protein